MAYADDLVIQGKDLDELGNLISELESLDKDWNLTVNHSKSEILAVKENDDRLIKEIRQVQIVKYLGVSIAKEDKTVISKNKAAVFKYLAYIKGRLRSASLDVKAALAQAYTKSLLLYFGVPLIAAGILKTD